jgi:hypothetical protein
MNIPYDSIKIEIGRILGIYIDKSDVPQKVTDIYDIIEKKYIESENTHHLIYEVFLEWVNKHTEEEFKSMVILAGLSK